VSRDERSEGLAGATVTVLGEAAIRTEPDEAWIWVRIEAIDESPGLALADVAKRSDALATLLDELAIGQGYRSTTGVTVAEEFDHTSEGRRSLGHRAVGAVLVRVTDMELIGRVVMRASEELDARLDGPSWRVSPTNPVRLEAAAKASANAKAKAAAYAAGVDARLGSLISLSEPDASARGIELASAAAGRGGNMRVEVGQQEVAARIHATFRLELA
jgi:uncharacterized protein YggE